MTPTATDDRTTVMKIEKVSGWAAGDFKDADYSSELTSNFGFFYTTALHGMFKVTPTALKLLGAASTTPKHTRLTYATPLEVVRFPVAEGQSHVTQSDVKGTMNFVPMIPTYLHEKYTIKVLKRGTLKLLPIFPWTPCW